MREIEHTYPPEVVSAALTNFSDWAELYELEEQIYLHKDLPDKPATTVTDIQDWVEDMRDYVSDISQVHYIRETDGNKIVAMMTTKMDADLPDGMIDALSVDPEHQGQGYGRRLVESAQELARQKKLRSLELIAAPHNRLFYRNLGFAALNKDGRMRHFIKQNP